MLRTRACLGEPSFSLVGDEGGLVHVLCLLAFCFSFGGDTGADLDEGGMSLV